MHYSVQMGISLDVIYQIAIACHLTREETFASKVEIDKSALTCMAGMKT